MVAVTQEVYDGLEAVRESGVTNMFAISDVQYYAGEMGYYDTAMWISDNKSDYGRGIFEGFEVANV